MAFEIIGKNSLDISDFKRAAQETCTPFTPPSAAEEYQRYERIIGKIKTIPEGKELLRFLEEHHIPIVFSRDTFSAAISFSIEIKESKYQPIRGTEWILLNPDRPDNDLSWGLFHEGRHARQNNGGLRMADKQVSPIDHAWYVRVAEADAEADNVLNLFKLKLNGDAALFDLGKNEDYREMYRVAEERYLQDPASLHNGRLKRMIFDTWFLSEASREGYDRNIVSKDWSWFQNLLSKYPGHGLVKSSLTASDVEKLGMVGGEDLNYLTLDGFRPIDDPYYKTPSPQHQQKLQEMTNTWENNFRPLGQKIIHPRP